MSQVARIPRETPGNVIPFPAYFRKALAGAAAIAAAVTALYLLPSGDPKAPAPEMAVNPVKVTAPSKSPVLQAPYQCTAGEVQGEVLVRHGAGQWIELAQGAKLYVGSSLKTGDGSFARLVYKDQTEVNIKPGSMVRISMDSLSIEQGATWLKVTKRGSRFEVKTPTAIAGVLGTRFGVSVDRKGSSCVALFEGKVWVGAAGSAGSVSNAARVVLDPGQKVAVAASGNMSPVVMTGPNEEALWSSPTEILNQETLNPFSSILPVSVPDAAPAQEPETPATTPPVDAAAVGADAPVETHRPQVNTSGSGEGDPNFNPFSGLDSDANIE